MVVPAPTPATRRRCCQRGDLGRCDVTRSTRVLKVLPPGPGRTPRADERRVLSNVVDAVRCRWCDAVNRVVLEPRPAGPAVGAEVARANRAVGADGPA